MKETALRLVRTLRYILRRTVEIERDGMDASAFREAFHEIAPVLLGVLTGKIPPEYAATLLECLDKAAQNGKMDGGPGSGNHGHKGVPGQRGGSAPSVAGGSSGSGVKSSGKAETEKGSGSSSGGNVKSGTSSGTVIGANSTQKKHPEGTAGAVNQPSSPTGVVKKPKIKPTHFKREGNTVEITEDTKIRTKDNKRTTMTAGKITDVYDFAGGSARKPVEKESFLIEQYGGKPGSWRHSAGNAQVKPSKGKAATVEVHWFENDEIGQTGWKVKSWKPHKKGGAK